MITRVCFQRISSTNTIKITINVIVLSTLIIVLSACSTIGEKMYAGPDRPDSEIATFRVYSRGMRVFLVDGKTVEPNPLTAGRTTRATIDPGKHVFNLFAYKDVRYARGDLSVDTVKGHTYLFNVSIAGDRAYFKVVDKGVDYDKKCLEPEAWEPDLHRKSEAKNC